MSTTYSIAPLSGSTDFRGISVASTTVATPTTAHTAQASATLPDLVTIDLENIHTSPVPYTLTWGGVTATSDVMTGVVLAGQTLRICTQKPIRNALVVGVASATITWIDGVSYTGVASKLIIHGHVQRQLT
jgi:hypothetical protein